MTSELSQGALEYIDELSNSKDVIYSQINSSGVAKNRNNALKHRVKGSVCLLCDDDVVYFKESFETILKEFQNNDFDFLTFKIKTFSGNDYKKYKSYAYRQTLRSLTGIGIIDVAFKEEVINRYALEFDERFGPGAYYAIGEDFIFMSDASKRGANIFYKPLDIVQHDEIGTGSTLEDKIIFGRGAMFARVFGVSSFLLNTVFALKNRKKYREKYSLFKYIKLLYQGTVDYYRNPKWN